MCGLSICARCITDTVSGGTCSGLQGAGVACLPNAFVTSGASGARGGGMVYVDNLSARHTCLKIVVDHDAASVKGCWPKGGRMEEACNTAWGKACL